MSPRLAVIILVITAPAAAGRTGQAEGFFKTRESVIKTYGSSSVPDLTRLYHETTDKARTLPAEGLLYRRAAFAELAGLYSDQERALLDILKARRGDAEVVGFSIEVFRANGSLTANIAQVLSAVDALGDKDRISAVVDVAHGYKWSKPPAEVLSAVRKAAKGEAETASPIQLAAALASWGYAGEAAETLAGKVSQERDADSLVALVRALDRIGARSRARRFAEDFFSKRLPAATPPGATLEELQIDREDRLELALGIAAESGAFDKLIDAVAVKGKAGDEALIDYATVLGGAGRYAEKAEVLRRLYELRRDADAAGLYGNALIRAGDAYSTQNTLMMSLLSSPGTDEDPYLDLFDAVSVLRDPQVFLQSASLFASLNRQPQTARSMSEYARVLGDFRLADRLFASFVVASNLGPDTRFNWEGSRLLANYYLDTGRLSDARSAAMRAIKQLLDVQGAKRMTRSSQPEKFIELFGRFGGVDQMLEYCVSREKDLPDSTLLLLMEQEALEKLGRWNEAWRVLARLNEGEPAAMRDVFLADSKSHAGRFDEAIRLYEKAIAADSRVPSRVRGDLMTLYAKAERWDDAMRFVTAGGSAGAASRVFLGAFYSKAGQIARAVRAYEMLDDITLEIAPEQLAPAVRFFAQRDPQKAARLLGRRLALQTSFWAKYDYMDECLPQDADMCASYLAIAATLEKGQLEADHQLMGLFYRLLSIRAEEFRDYRAARAAARAACAHDPRTLENQQQLARILSGADAAGAEGVARSMYAALPLPSILLELADAELSLKRISDAGRHLDELAAAGLSPAESHELICLLERYPVGRERVEKVREAITSAWSWTLRARLADAALARGDSASALGYAGPVIENGTYVGRALWAADFYARAGDPGQAGTVIELFKAASSDHPALVIAEVDIARSRGDLAGASGAVASARKRALRPHFAALFRMEAARAAVGLSAEPKGGRR